MILFPQLMMICAMFGGMSVKATTSPTSIPSFSPSADPTVNPSPAPSTLPTTSPTFSPSVSPTIFPSNIPTSSLPTSEPSHHPSSTPSFLPSRVPTVSPSTLPSSLPSSIPTSPTSVPTHPPSNIPSGAPSSVPSGEPTANPSPSPTSTPTSPSSTPTTIPTALPTGAPSGFPSMQPTSHPSTIPTAEPSGTPSGLPTNMPSGVPSSEPTSKPSGEPTGEPTLAPISIPTSIPSALPSGEPTGIPSGEPTSVPSGVPSGEPTSEPSGEPTVIPSSVPTSRPTSIPSALPSGEPTGIPSGEPTSVPSGVPSGEPTSEPSGEPTVIPSSEPTSGPTSIPSALPSGEPTGIPSGEPTSVPSGVPSGEPTSEPSGEPTGEPSSAPSSIPTSVPTLQPTLYNGTECVGVVDFHLFSTSPFEQLEYNVSRLMAYQSPVWIDTNCKQLLRQYSCALVYQPYGVFYSLQTKQRVERKYCSALCDDVDSACNDFFKLARDIDLRYDNENSYDDYSSDPQKFVSEQCARGAWNQSSDVLCYYPRKSQVVEDPAQCPDPSVVPDDNTLSSTSVFIPRFEGSECAIACPNLWYRQGTYYLNTYVLYIVSVLSCVLGFVTLCQHAYVIYQARAFAQTELTMSIMAARKKTVLSEQVVMLCFGVSISNTVSVLFMMVNNLSEKGLYPLQCEGNSGFLLRNSFCTIQGALLIFSICWQQAWTGRICSHIFGIIRPYDRLAIFFQTLTFKIIQGYFCYVHPVVCVAVFTSLNYVGNYWKSEYNFCGPSFGKSPIGDLLFLLLIWLPVMVFGPVYVLGCTSLVIKSVQQDIRPANTEISTDRFEDRSSNEDFGSNRQSEASLVSVDFASESGVDGVRMSEYKSSRASSSTRPSEISPLPRLTKTRFAQQTQPPPKTGVMAYFITLLRSLYVYRRIVFLILSSVLSLSAAFIVAQTATKINRYSQESFYNCMLLESAYDINNANSGKCGGQDRRIEVSWRIFVVQIFMISFGIGPFFAFGTESVRGAVRRLSVFVGRLLATRFIISCMNVRAYVRRFFNRPISSDPMKQPRPTERMTHAQDDSMSATSSPFGRGESMGNTSSKYYENEDISMESTLGPEVVSHSRKRSDTDVFSDMHSGDVRLSDFMQRGGGYEFEEFD